MSINNEFSVQPAGQPDGYDYYIYKHDDNSYILIVNYHNNTTSECPYLNRSEYIRKNNSKNIENIIKHN